MNLVAVCRLASSSYGKLGGTAGIGIKNTCFVAEEPCAACPDRDCVRGGNRTKLDARSCPSLLNPARLKGSSDCLVCGQCVKACSPGNMGLFLRPLFHRADARESIASWPVTLFVMLVSGFVVIQMFSEWPAAQQIFLWLPNQVATGLGWTSHTGWIRGVWALIVAPTVLWTLLAGTFYTLREFRLAQGAAHRSYQWPTLVLAAGLLFLVFGWGFLQ